MKDRDVYTPKHPTPAPGVPAFIEEDPTGKFEGEELRVLRSRRKTDERIARLEDKHDKLSDTVTEFRVDIGEKVGGMVGKLDTVLEHFAASQATERVRISSRAKVLIAVVGAIGAIGGAIVTAMSGCA